MPYSVMLVDNEPVIQRGLMQLIDWKALGCYVRSIAYDGADAVRQIQESPPDIVITDIRMPEMDGLQLCAWVREHCPDIQLILCTGFPDFEYAQQAIQYEVADFVLKPTTEEGLSAAVKKACQRLQKDSGIQKRSLLLEQQALLGELIFKSRHSMLYILNRLNDLHITLSSYYVLSLEVVFQGPLEEGTAMLQQAQDIFLSCCEGQTVYLVPKSDLCSYAVLPLPEDADPLALCTAAVEAVDGSTDFLLTIGISRCHKNPLNMRKAAQEADDAQKFLLSSSQPSVMRCQDLPRLSEETTNLLLEKLRLVESALENRSGDTAMKHLGGLFQVLRAIPFSSAYQIALLLKNFCISLLLSHDLSPDRLAEMPDLDGGSMESLESGLRDYLTSTLAQMGRAPENIDSIIYEVKQYIDQNYSASLSLDALAAMVHLSPTYFSKLFKREMGENLSTYILNTRIEHAKLLLRTTDKKAYEIAEAVGIYDPVYFSKIFKKAVGRKPKEYRERPDAEETERMIKS